MSQTQGIHQQRVPIRGFDGTNITNPKEFMESYSAFCLKEMPHANIYEAFVRLYYCLEFLGIVKGKAAKQKMLNLANDGRHAFFGGYCNMVVSKDVDFINKANFLYGAYGIHPYIIPFEEFKNWLISGPRPDDSIDGLVIVLTVTAVFGLLLFIWRELSTDYPIVNFKIMHNRSFAIGMFTSFILGLGLYGSNFVFPNFCQSLLGFSSEQSGLLLLPGGLFTIAMMPFVGRMLNKGLPAQFMATAGLIQLLQKATIVFKVDSLLIKCLYWSMHPAK